MYEDEVVALPALPVLDNMKFKSVTFGVFEPTGEPYAEVCCFATSSKDPKLPGKDRTLRLYASAEEFKAKWRADDESAMKELIQAQTNEEPVPPAEEEPE